MGSYSAEIESCGAERQGANIDTMRARTLVPLFENVRNAHASVKTRQQLQ